MLLNLLALAIALVLLTAPLPVPAQQIRVHQVGIIHQGGSYYEAIAGLRDELKELGWTEGQQYVLHARDAKGDLKAVESAARSLETEKVGLICTLATSVTLRAKRATNSVPIVFHAGTDPVSLGLIESFRKPGGRLTGVYSQVTDITAKRLEILKEMVPGLRRIMVFFNPDNASARESLQDAREAARQLRVTIVERPVRSVEELRAALAALRPADVDAIFHVSDATVTGHADLIVQAATAKRLPLIAQDREGVLRGALASYGPSYYTSGRLMAKYVQRVLLGANPGDLPVEQFAKLQFVVNLKTAKTIGLAIPQAALARADEVIQ